MAKLARRRASRLKPLSAPVIISAIALAAQPPIHVDVDVVQVPCIVTDTNGAAVRDLQIGDFSITENNQQQDIKYLWRDTDLPMTVGLIGDVSGSQRAFVRKHQQTISQFLSHLMSSGDEAFLVAVSNQQRLAVDLTGSSDELQNGVGSLTSMDLPALGDPCLGKKVADTGHTRKSPGRGRKQRVHGTQPGDTAARRGGPCGGTALWNGVYFAAKLKLQPEQGRKALLILTDGFDTGSDHSLSDAIEACQAANTMVYVVHYAESPYLTAMVNPIGAPITIAMLKYRIARGARDIARITLETGGLDFDGSRVPLTDIFARIEDDLRSQYVLGFVASDKSPGVHKIHVTVKRPDLRVRARRWYVE